MITTIVTIFPIVSGAGPGIKGWVFKISKSIKKVFLIAQKFINYKNKFLK